MESFKVLDYRRLGKQRVEAMQILNVLSGVQQTKGWHSHPAVLMWKGYETALMMYHDDCIIEWTGRGYKNSMALKYYDDSNGSAIGSTKGYPEMPWWLGDENFHRSHRARLIAKLPDFYEPLFPDDKDFNNGKYFWPVNETKTFKII
jgi:hypothetical protein